MYTLEEIFVHHAKCLNLHNVDLIIEDAVKQGYTVRAAVDFLRTKGYCEGQLEEALDRLRKLRVIAPWEPD